MSNGWQGAKEATKSAASLSTLSMQLYRAQHEAKGRRHSKPNTSYGTWLWISLGVQWPVALF